MAAPFDNIVQHLFHQPSIHSVTVDELENMAQQHPYFAAAHFLLLKKMQDASHPAFTEQLQKTTIYFNNPLWLQYLLQPETVADFTVSGTAPFISNEPVQETADASAEPLNGIPQQLVSADNEEVDSIATEEQTAHVTGEDTALTPSSQHGSMMDVIDSVFEAQRVNQEALAEDHSDTENNSFAPTEQVHEEELVQDENANTAAAAFIPEPGVTDEEHIHPVDHDVSFVEEENANHLSVEPVIEDGHIQTENTAAENPPAETLTDDESHFSTAAEFTQHDTAPAEHTQPEAEVSRFNNDQSAADATDAVPDEPSTAAPVFERPLLKTIIETPAAKDDMLFEPYHTVDYFASQGIKLSKTDADPKDKLGRQLKSFTDWLKTMKKHPKVTIDKILSENEETKVVMDAIHSIENKEVITETMAEVFEKQGMHDNAAEIYRKLSLLNPSKSAYFAARIEALKQ